MKFFHTHTQCIDRVFQFFFIFIFRSLGLTPFFPSLWFWHFFSVFISLNVYIYNKVADMMLMMMMIITMMISIIMKGLNCDYIIQWDFFFVKFPLDNNDLPCPFFFVSSQKLTFLYLPTYTIYIANNGISELWMIHIMRLCALCVCVCIRQISKKKNRILLSFPEFYCWWMNEWMYE